MAKVVIQNTTQSDLGLNPSLVVPAMGVREVTADELAACQKSPVVQHYFDKGLLKKPAPAKAEPKSKPSKAKD